MVNGINNIMLIDGRMILHETLGAYATVVPSTYQYDYNNINTATLGSWSDTLGLIEDPSLYEETDSGYTQETETDSELQRLLQSLKMTSEELLRKLSEAIIQNYYVIPDNYKIEICVKEPEEIVYKESEVPDNAQYDFSIKLSLGNAQFNFSENNIETVKTRLTDIVHGCILFAKSGISFKE